MNRLLIILFVLISVACDGDKSSKTLPDGSSKDVLLGLCLKRESGKENLNTLADVAEAGYRVSKACGVSIEKVMPYLQLVEQDLEIGSENGKS